MFEPMAWTQAVRKWDDGHVTRTVRFKPPHTHREVCSLVHPSRVREFRSDSSWARGRKSWSKAFESNPLGLRWLIQRKIDKTSWAVVVPDLSGE